jgi:acetylornithine deacetylase/succinyl-diaminopimelate desuccinylase-like protein
MRKQERGWKAQPGARWTGGAACALAAVLVLLAGASAALANGGTLRLANVPMGEYRVSAFTDPTPVRPDTLDVSVLVVREGVTGVAEDVRVTVRTRALEGQGPETVREATREQADDPRYHAAKFALGAEGEWEVTVAVIGPHGQGEASFRLRARERGLLGHPLVLMGLALLPLLAVALWIFREEEGGATDEEATASP